MKEENISLQIVNLLIGKDAYTVNAILREVAEILKHRLIVS